LKRRLDETETINERLTSEHRWATKELIIYKHLDEIGENSSLPGKSKQSQQLRTTIDTILKENRRLYNEIQEFKTSDPVYDQLKLLEIAHQYSKDELHQLVDENHRLKTMINGNEINQLRSRLKRADDKYEQLLSVNQQLFNETESYREQLRAVLSADQVRRRTRPCRFP
jgi:murein L,D-transpeptidase YcbB/YkuD